MCLIISVCCCTSIKWSLLFVSLYILYISLLHSLFFSLPFALHLSLLHFCYLRFLELSQLLTYLCLGNLLVNLALPPSHMYNKLPCHDISATAHTLFGLASTIVNMLTILIKIDYWFTIVTLPWLHVAFFFMKSYCSFLSFKLIAMLAQYLFR